MLERDFELLQLFLLLAQLLHASLKERKIFLSLLQTALRRLLILLVGPQICIRLMQIIVDSLRKREAKKNQTEQTNKREERWKSLHGRVETKRRRRRRKKRNDEEVRGELGRLCRREEGEEEEQAASLSAMFVKITRTRAKRETRRGTDAEREKGKRERARERGGAIGEEHCWVSLQFLVAKTAYVCVLCSLLCSCLLDVP